MDKSYRPDILIIDLSEESDRLREPNSLQAILNKFQSILNIPSKIATAVDYRIISYTKLSNANELDG